MESIIAALISAVASVIVALISKKSAASETNNTPVATGARKRSKVVWSGKKQWRIAILLLIAWLLLSPPLIHWDIVGINLFVIVAVTVVISFVWPIKPLAASAIVLILHPVNFAMEPLAKGLRGMNPQGRLEPSKIALLLSIFLGNAILAAFLCAWRGKATVLPPDRQDKSVGFGAGQGQSSDSLSHELDRLGSLRAQGVITEEEFQKAKAKVLNA
jgi:putative oligomerization/nucleic acid binding protein